MQDFGERIISSSNAEFSGRTDQELAEGPTTEATMIKRAVSFIAHWQVYMVNLGQKQKSEVDMDVRANPPTVKQNRVGGFRLKNCV